MADDAEPSDKPIAIKTALARFKLGVDARHKQRAREKAALEFQVPALQWPEDVKKSRQGQTFGNLAVPPRPMLSIPSLDQPIQLVLNQEKAAHLGVQVHPVSEDADDDTAEVLQGLYRRIEVDSRANLARSWGFDRAAKCGTGDYEVTTEYDPDGGHPSDQRIVIKRILYQGSVVRDPFAQEPDWSDGMWEFKTSEMGWATYKQKYKNSKLAKYDASDFKTLGEDEQGWVTGEGEGRAVRIAAYYEIRLTVGDDGRETRTLWYSIINAIEELEPAAEQDGRYIPLIPVVGRELIPFDNERRWTGIIEPNMDAVRMLNYAASAAVELAALEPKAPWMIAEGQDEGHEQEFLQANTRNLPAIHYKPVTLGGQPVPPPMRVQADVSKLGPSMMLLQQAREFIHSGTGAFEAALGQSASQNKTKGGIQMLQDQHQQGNSHFLDNLAEITLTYEALVVLDKIPHIYDRPGRIARILDKENKPQTVMLNQPFTRDPQTKRPIAVPPGGLNGNGNGNGIGAGQAPQIQPPAAPSPGGPGAQPGMAPQPGAPPQGAPQGPPAPEVLHYDLKKGRYGITVDVGKAQKSNMEAGSESLAHLFQAEPQLFGMLGDIWLKMQTWDGHIEAAERMKKMLPAPLQDQNDANAAQQQLGQLKQHAQQLEQQLQQAGKIIETKQVEQKAKVDVEQIHASMTIELQKMKDATAIRVAQINAMTKGVLAAHGAEDEDLALGRQHAFDQTQNEQDRQHEAAMAHMGQQHALEQGQQGAQADAAQSAQDHGQALQQGDQSHQNALAQGQQAADLAPPPDAGASA